MSYTMTYDASLKVKRAGGHAKGLLRHIARDADEAAGFSFAHSNENIDPDLTSLNASFVNDGAGGFRAMRSVEGQPPSDELSDYLEKRLSTVKGSLRKDAVAIRPLILQLDPKWFDDHNPDWRENGLNDVARRYTEESLRWAVDEFGHANIVGGSLHCDEVSPQLHVLVTPITADGRLSQKDFFKGPTDFKRQHKQLRERMEAAGYDVEHRVTARSTERLSSAEFKAESDRARKTAALLAVAEKDAEKALAERQAARAELAAARGDADTLRRDAQAEGYSRGYEDGERLGFNAGTRTAEQTIQRRVAEEAAHERQRLRLEREGAEQVRRSYLEGLKSLHERLQLLDKLADEIQQGKRIAEPGVVEMLRVTREAERKRAAELLVRHPELRPSAHDDHFEPHQRSAGLESQ